MDKIEQSCKLIDEFFENHPEEAREIVETINKLLEGRYKEFHCYLDSYPDVCLHSYTYTMNAIDEDLPLIRTTCITCLDFYGLYQDKKYRIFVHKNGKSLEIYPGMNWDPNGEPDREIRIYHDIRRMITGGTFDNYFNA